MADMLLDKLAGIEVRYDELERLISDPANVSDYEKVAELAQERAEIADIVSATREYRQALDELEQAQALIDDPDMAELAREEASALESRITKLEEQLRRMLLPRDPRDDKNVIMEIRAGTGGDEAGLFAAALFRMYTRYAENHRWKIEIISANETGVGGYKEIVFEIKGKGAYSRLKFESGVHRVQRVPATEAATPQLRRSPCWLRSTTWTLRSTRTTCKSTRIARQARAGRTSRRTRQRSAFTISPPA